VTLVVLVLLAIIIIPKVFNPNDHRETIIALVKDKTDRDLRLDGDLSVSVFPWLGVRTQGLGLSQPSSIGGDMVAVENAQLRIKLLPLFSKRVEIDTVVLDQPLLRIVTLKNGTDSFSGLFDGDEADAATQSSSSDDESSDLDVAIVIEGVEINNAQVIIDNRSEQQRYEVNEFNLNTGNLISGKLADISASGILLDSTNPQSIEFDMGGRAKVDIESLDVEMADIKLDVLMGEDKVSLNFAALSFTQSQLLNIDQLTAQWAGAQSAQLSAPSIVVDLDKQTANIQNANASMGDLNAGLSNISATRIIDAPSVKGRLTVADFNARELINDFDVDYQPSSTAALKSISLASDFAATKEMAGLSAMTFKLDDSTLKGDVSVANFDKPQIKFDLSLDKLNLDDYLPEDEQDQEASETTGEIDGDALTVPMSALRELNANGQFVAEQLISGGLEFNDIDVTIASTAGKLTITPKANLYDGKTSGVISFTEQGDTSVLKINNEVDAVALGELLTSADITEQLSGLGTLLVDVVVTEKNGVQSNEGTIKLTAKNGTLKGVDLQGMIRKGYNSYKDLKGETSSNEEFSSSSDDETKFAEMLGTFNLKDFKITNNDFSMKAPLFRVGGAGDIFLDSQTLDYKVDFAVVNSIKGQGGDAFDSLKGLNIPIRLTGALTEPKYSIDWTALYKNIAKQKVEEEKAKLLKEKLGLEGEDTSTKGVLKQLLEKELDKGSDESVAEDAEPKSEKDQLKDELKNRLLKGLFN